MAHKTGFVARFGPLLIAGAAFLWSLDGLIRASSLYALPPVLISFWEHLLGLFLITPFFWFKRHEIKKLTKKDWIPVVLIAFFAGPVAGILYTYALTQISFANFSIVTLLQQTQPIWAVLIASLVLKEKISKMFVVLAAIAMVGVYMIVFPTLHPNLNTGTGTVLAGTLAILAAMSWGSATSLGKFVLNKVSFSTMAFLRFSLASIFAFIIFLGFSLYQSVTKAADIFGKSHAFNQFFSLTQDQWFNLGIIVLVTGAGAMLLFYLGLKHTPARVSTICELTWPASSLIIGILFFKNTFTPTQIAGIVILISSMLAISYTQREKDIVVAEKDL